MKALFRFAAVGLAMLIVVSHSLALSEERHSPDIFFPKTYAKEKSERVLAVLRSPEFKYLTGLTSYWEPDYSTTLVYGGDTAALQAFLAALRKVEGFGVKVTSSRDLAKETGSALVAGSWWVIYRHTTPDTVEVRVNRAAKELNVEKLDLPPAK
jgi:hypothetical protein